MPLVCDQQSSLMCRSLQECWGCIIQADCKKLEHHLDRHISKQESMTDWSKRPLQNTQLQYAAQDARVLLSYSPICSNNSTTSPSKSPVTIPHARTTRSGKNTRTPIGYKRALTLISQPKWIGPGRPLKSFRKEHCSSLGRRRLASVERRPDTGS